jgi:hypothetical protein
VCLALVLCKSLNFDIWPDPNQNPAFNRIHANPDPGSMGFVSDHLGFITTQKNPYSGRQVIVWQKVKRNKSWQTKLDMR